MCLYHDFRELTPDVFIDPTLHHPLRQLSPKLNFLILE